jgi:TPR repeat protein
MKTIRSTLRSAALAALLGISGLAAAAGPPAQTRGQASPPVSPALRSAAEAGDARSQYQLASALACGRGARTNLAEAAGWFDKAARQGHVQSKSVLGWMLMNGRGVPRDDARALALLTEAADAGSASAQNNLGVMYATGQGVPADERAAEKWFRKAADQGALDAVRNLDELRKGNGKTARPMQDLPDFKT